MKMNVLIVEDCEVMQSMIRRTLHISGLEFEKIDIAGNGKEGLDKLENGSYDLILLDINMPVMDGLEMIENLQKNAKSKSIPIIIVSADKQENRKLQLEKSVKLFVYKPFTPEFLKKNVLRVLNNSKSLLTKQKNVR